MGWKDGTPVGQSGSPPKAAPSVASPAQDVTPATDATGWRSGQAVGQPAAATPSGPQPSNVPWFSFGSGPDKIGEFVGKMADSSTAGFGAQALDKLGVAQGPNGQTVAQQVENAGKDIGPLGSAAADMAGYAVGPGKFALGERIAGRLGEGILARMGGSALENAGASVAGTVGHGDTNVGDNLRSAALGLTIGGLSGGLPGVRGELAPVEKDTTGILGSGIGAKTANSPTPGLGVRPKPRLIP